MAITFIKERKKQKYLVWIFAVVIVGILAVFLFGSLWNKNIFQVFKPPAPQPPPDITVNFDFLKSEALKALKPFEAIVPLTESAGRQNPFSPY